MTGSVHRLPPLPSDELSKEDAVAEVRDLVADLRAAAQDGRFLAARYADLLRTAVDEYCIEFEQRAEAALKRLEEIK